MTTENFTVPQMEMYIKLHTDLIDVSQKNLDSLLGMTDMYGNKFSPSTAQNVLTGRDLKGFTDSRMGLINPDVIEKFAKPVAPMGVNVPSTGIQTIDVGFNDPAFDNTLQAKVIGPALTQMRSLEKAKVLSDQGYGTFSIEDQQKLDQLKELDADPTKTYSMVV